MALFGIKLLFDETFDANSNRLGLFVSIVDMCCRRLMNSTCGERRRQPVGINRLRLVGDEKVSYLIIGVHRFGDDVGVLLVALVPVVVLAADALDARTGGRDAHRRVEMGVLPPLSPSARDP